MSTHFSHPITMIARRVGDVSIHTFISSFADDNIADATHIIESRYQLILIDGQFLAHYARAFRAYADKLKKPIARLYLTHTHPDHWYGLSTAFRDVPIYALPETKAIIEKHGQESRTQHLEKLGDQAPPAELVVPTAIANLGTETLDGVQFVFSKVIDTETAFHLIIGLPQLKVAVVQDLIYSGTHLYLTKNMVHWIQILGDMLLSEYDLFLAGHGVPADKNEVARNIEYLAAANQAIANGLKNNVLKDFMLQRYPDRKCPAIFDIYLPRLFDGVVDPMD